MEKDLEKYLKILNSERCLKKPKEAGVLINKICECFNQEKSQFVIGLLIGLLLEEHNAIFTFIWKTSSEFETVSSTTAAFRLLEHIVVNFPSCAEPYYPVLFEKCVYILNRKLAKVKEVSLKLIKNLIIADTRLKLDLSILISELEKHLRDDKKIQGSVAEQIYSLLGYLFEKHPETIRNKEWFLENICESLRWDCTVTKNPSVGRVKGAFEGINGYLTSFSLPNAETAKNIYEYIKTLSKFHQDKKVASRVGLKILQNHWSHFLNFIYNDREFWRINLEVWTKQKKEDSLPAFQFLCAFYSVIAHFAQQNSNNSEVSSYAKQFIETLETDSNSYEKRAALIGMKFFILTDCLKETDIKIMYEVLMNFIKKNEACTTFPYFPLCIECISAFVLKLSIEKVSTEQLAYLQSLSVKLIESYPYFQPALQLDAVVALEKSFYLLGLTNSQVMGNHIEKVLYQGLIRSCSSMTAIELEILKEKGQPSSGFTSYKSYVNLWKYLLTLSSSPNLPVNSSYALKKGVAGRVFDVFFKSFLKIISKLNFNIGEDMEVEKPSDLHIFINAIDLYQDLIPVVDSSFLQKWLIEILKTVIDLSRKNPLVCGFYKIMAVNLRVADGLEFFDVGFEEKQKCIELVRTYLEEILPRIDQFKGDLQMSCLKMILTAPVKVIESFVEKTVPALEVAVYRARSCFQLLKDLIETLERWDLNLPTATSNAIMEKILPSFDMFFQSPYFSGNNLVDTSIEGKKLKKNLIFSDSELLTVQKKFLMFLGHLDIRKSLNLIEQRAVEENNLDDKDLVYLLPFIGGDVEINMNEILPRVLDLAASCIDRKTRITACELLNSEVLLLLGNIKQLSGVYTALFKKTIRTCVILGCDSDGVVCQIFEPLMYQIVRYFSGKEALNFTESNDLIDILMDCITRPHNPTLRDFSAHLIKEFTIWSIKQVTPEELRVTPKSVSRILKSIYSLSLHPSFNKRLGAAIVFNRIYSVLREEEFILNAYWFQLFYYFMESLRMCEGPDDVTEILEAIEHVKRPLMEKCAEFNEDSPEREVPPEFEGRRLCHLVKWTMERACDVKPSTRRTAMAMVEELAPLVENCDSRMPFVSKQFRDFFMLKENSFQSDFNDEDFITWLNYQIAGFEYCTWLLEQKVFLTEDVLQPQFIAVLKSYIVGIMSPRENATSATIFQQKSVLAFLNLLHALKERAYMYPPVLWDLLKVAVFTPSALGFQVNQKNMGGLASILTELLKYFSTHLTAYDWELFYRDLETIVSVPAFSRITGNQEIGVKNYEFLFAFKIIQGSGLWVSFREKMFFQMSENLFLVPIFKSLFFSRGKIVYAASLEPSCKIYLEEVLKIMLTVNEDLKGVFGCIENEEEVQEEDTGKKVKKGEFFLFTFNNTIFSFLGRKHSLLIERVLQKGTITAMKLLVQIVENLSEDSDLPAAILQRWHDFEILKIKDSSQMNKVLLQLTLSCAKFIGVPGVLKATPIAETIYSILESKKFQEMDLFETAFKLLPFVSDFAEDKNDRLSECLMKFEVDQNALKGSMAQEGFKLRTVKFVVHGILESLKATASLVLFRFALIRASWFDAVCKKEDMDAVLTVFAERTPMTHSQNALKLAYEFCFENDKMHSASIIYKLFVNPLMRLLPNAAVYQLMDENLENLCELLTTYWGEEKNLSKIKANMIKKICAAGMFQIFVTKLRKEELDEMPRERRQLIDAVVKKVFLLLKYPYPPKVLEERYRKLMCEIFNMICCIISARCKEEKFYKLFIFDERGSFLYAAVDKNSTYNLEMDFEEIPKRKKLLTFLQERRSKESQMRVGENSVKYIHTNTLFTSSLREDVTRFDFTKSTIRPMDSVSQETVRNVEIELEMDSLNSHECMAVLVATVSKMVQDKITPGDDVSQLPCWLKFFLSILSNSDLCENIKFFVLKAIYNTQNFVAPYCKQIFPGLLESILELFKNHPLNYFLIDLIELMIGWMHLPEEEKSRWQLTELVVLILNKSDSFRREIMKNNLEVLKAMIEAWKKVLHLPELSSVAFKRLSKSVEKDLKSNVNGDGLTYFNAHLCGILLSNGIPTWKEGSEEQFFQLISRNFRQESRHNELFGELCGLALSHIEKNNPNALGEFEELVRDKISSLPVCWLQVLYGVHKHHPKMSSFFTYKISSSAWDSTDSLIAHKLEMLLSHVSRAQKAEDSTFERHSHMFLIDMLNSPDAVVQELSLQIADKLLGKFDDDKLMDIMKEVMRLQRSIHSDVRKWVYEISVKLYWKNNELQKHCRIILLNGLSDGVKELEDLCLKFWRSALDLSSLGTTLLQVLRVMYTPEAENIFLSNSIKVLLQFATDTGQSEKHIFLHPITHKCRFQKRNLILTPRHSVFSPSLSRSLANESVEHIATVKNQNLPYLRPTSSSLIFEPTMQESSEEVSPQNLNTEEEIHVPSNPFRRRFYKSEAKKNFPYVMWQNKKKKREINEEEEMKRRKETALDIYGEYRDGDFPDIQLRHSQILKLFEALAKKDHHFARQFLVSLYSGLIKAVNSHEKNALLTETGKCFEEMLKSSGSFDPGVFGFVLQLILKHTEDFDIDCRLISNAAVASNWLSLGALIIEAFIANEDNSGEKSAKRRKGCETFDEVRWLELAKLYRNLEEFDVLSGIFRDKLNVQSEAREAIHCETLLNWLEASKHYESLLRTEPESGQSEFYTESYFSCLAKLSNWSLLNKCIRSTVGNELDELWKNYNLLSWFLKSEVMISLGSGKNEIHDTLEEFCKNAAKKSILFTNFGEELAAFDLLSNKFQNASYRIDRLCLDFLAGWSHLDQWSYNLRTVKLSGLQTLSELGFAVKNLAEVSKAELERNINLGRRRWEKSLPTPSDDLTIWDVKLGYRRQFLKRLEDFDLSAVEIRSYLALARAALNQDNLNMAKEYLSRAKDGLPDEDYVLKAEYDNCFNRGKMVVARLKMKDENMGLEMYLNVWRSISKEMSNFMEADSISFKNNVYNCNFMLGQLVSEILPYVKKESVSQAVLESVRLMLEAPEGINVASALERKGLHYLEAAKVAIDGVKEGPSTIKSNVYLELAKFLLKFSNPGTFPELEKCYAYTLKSMAQGNLEARQLFGCLLNMSNHFPDESFSFDNLLLESDHVPSYMFIMWINQMLSCLSSNLFIFLKSILLRITQDYPNAIRYPLKLSGEKEYGDVKTKSFLLKLNGIVSKDRLYEDFWNSMKFLAPPCMILRYHLEDALQEASEGEPNYLRITKIVSELKEIMFSVNFSKFRGPIFKSCENFKDPVEDLIKGFENKEVLIRKLRNLLSSIETSKLPSRRGLDSYSPWLYSFHSLKADTPLELPGQYDGNTRPIKKYMVTVTSFRNNILVFNSKCKPMRITILGNDATEHMFLVKFGEDLRQDERIQQVFRHFCYKLRESRQTKRFSLDTYKVIPLTYSLGMIEWVDSTVSLYEMIENSLENGKDALARAQNAHLVFLSQGSPLTVPGSLNGSVAAHLSAYEKIKRETAISHFKLRVQQFPRDLLKKSFLTLSTSPEHFVHLRKNFATSHAVMCITHWLVGIGDRHLQNTLVSTKTGRAIGIDFGYAFGFATQFLTPPELVPFRLSPQILGLLHPLEESGWIKQTMIHCLRLFRKNNFGLLSVLEVFAREPLMDWLKQARISQRCRAENPDTWYPREKLSLVAMKLNGANPVITFEADLKKGHSQSKYFKKYLEVLKGVHQDNIRARCEDDGLTEKEQIECLIDLATDAHVLSKTYVGWNPWL